MMVSVSSASQLPRQYDTTNRRKVETEMWRSDWFPRFSSSSTIIDRLGPSKLWCPGPSAPSYGLTLTFYQTLTSRAMDFCFYSNDYYRFNWTFNWTFGLEHPHLCVSLSHDSPRSFMLYVSRTVITPGLYFYLLHLASIVRSALDTLGLLPLSMDLLRLL